MDFRSSKCHFADGKIIIPVILQDEYVFSPELKFFLCPFEYTKIFETNYSKGLSQLKKELF